MRVRPVAWLLAITVLVALVVLLQLYRGLAPVDGDTLEGWGLPRDLAGQLDHVEVLRLPPSVTRLDWLPDHLKELEIQGVLIEEGCDLPTGLRRLDVSYASLQCLEGLPAGIAVLDARWSEPETLRALEVEAGDSLRVLLTGGSSGSPSRLPEALYAFGSFDTTFEDGSFLPRGLRELYLQGPGVIALRGLPQDLTVLSLEATRVRDLSGIPGSVTSFTLQETPTPIRVESWPPFLASLSVTVPSVRLTGDLPASLRTLHVSGTRGTVGAQNLPALPEGLLALSVHPADAGLLNDIDLPPHLERLDLTGFQGGSLPVLPRSLSELVLAYAWIEELGPLPASLRSLDMSGLDPILLSALPEPRWPPEGLERLIFHRFPNSKLISLPETLRHLDVAGSSKLVDLGKLPSGLERLDVSSTGLTKLPDLRRLRLRSLSIAGARIDSVDGLLPDGLEELVLAPGQIKTLGRLSQTLRVLRFEGEASPPAPADPSAEAAE